MEEKIAVLLPVYKNDKPEYFRTALDSILTQSYHNFEVLIGVDGPVEGELAAILSNVEHAEKVKVIYFPQNRGLACVLNDLIDVGRKDGVEFFARMDADDISVKDRFVKQMDFLLKNSDVDVVGGAIEEIDECGNKNGKKVSYPKMHDECRAFFRYRDPLAHPATFFRNSYFEKCGGYRPEYRKNQDTMLWFDGFMNGCKFANLEEVVLNFRVEKDFYRRRSGWKRAKQMFMSRIEINRQLGYDATAYLFLIAMTIMTMSPGFIKKLLYRIR